VMAIHPRPLGRGFLRDHVPTGISCMPAFWRACLMVVDSAVLARDLPGLSHRPVTLAREPPCNGTAPSIRSEGPPG
jgi:hypothetical protein